MGRNGQHQKPNALWRLQLSRFPVRPPVNGQAPPLALDAGPPDHGGGQRQHEEEELCRSMRIFLRHPQAVDATNWRAEQAIRPAVVTCKVWGENRSWRGARAQHTLASVIRTACQRNLNPHAALVSLLCATTPTVAPDFGGPPVADHTR